MNKALKKLLCPFLCTILLCGVFSGCRDSSQENVNNAAQAYIDMAQEYIADGNYTSAIDVLKKGYSSTGDERINALLQGVLSTQSADSTTDATEPPTIIPPTIEPPTTEPPTTEPPTTEPPTTEPPTTEPPITEPPSSPTFLTTHSGTISISSANISLQDSAVLYITLSYAGSVSYTCEPNNIVTLTWGDFDYSNTVPLYITAQQNGSASIRIYETDYPNNHLTVNVTVSNHTAYDTSKASGILAEAGLTEQEFRNICTYVAGSWYDNRKNAYAYTTGRQYYSAHPEENRLLDSYTEDWYDYQIFGTEANSYDTYNKEDLKNSNSLDDYLNFKIYGPKGAQILENQSKEIFKKMREYPADYVNQPFLLKNLNVESIYGNTYYDENYILFGVTTSVVDYRDDVNYPNILDHSNYDMYVIFLGTNGSDNLVFALISVEKCD